MNTCARTLLCPRVAQRFQLHLFCFAVALVYHMHDEIQRVLKCVHKVLLRANHIHEALPVADSRIIDHQSE
jgi:Ran GTPase-activating protein (RanGAP) involved in mRNA processing and transport